MTERVEPLVEWMAARGEEDAAGTPAALCWGLHCITKALAFINSDCKLVHGNVCRDSVFVTKARRCVRVALCCRVARCDAARLLWLQSGDWVLGGFELLTAASTSPSDWPSAMFREHDPAIDVKCVRC